MTDIETLRKIMIHMLAAVLKALEKDKLWPINEPWDFHAGSNEGNNKPDIIQKPSLV